MYLKLCKSLSNPQKFGIVKIFWVQDGWYPTPKYYHWSMIFCIDIINCFLKKEPESLRK